MRYLWKMGYDDRCLTAALLNMASKGHLKIWEDHDKQYVVTKTEGNLPLSEDELKIMQQLLPGGGEIRLETEDSRLPAAVSVFSDYLRSNYEKISFVSNSRYFGVGLLLSVLMVLANGLGSLTDPAGHDILHGHLRACNYLQPASPLICIGVSKAMEGRPCPWRGQGVPDHQGGHIYCCCAILL